MKASLGLVRINLHKVTGILDESKQVQSISYYDKIVSIKKGVNKINATITNNVATITDESYSQGDEVDIWLACVRSKEDGGICDPVPIQADEDKWEAYLDLL